MKREKKTEFHFAGIFIERIYRRMSTSQLIFIPPEVEKCLQASLSFLLIKSCYPEILIIRGKKVLKKIL